MMDFSDPQGHPDGMSQPKQAIIPELGNVVDALPGLVWTALPDGRVDFVNQQWREYTGVSSLDSSGAAWQMAIHPEDLPRLLECLRSSISSRHPCEAEVRMRRFDGEFRWFAVRANPITDASGAVVKCCGLNWDIEDRKRGEELLDVTRRKHVEEELRRTAAFLAQAQHISSTGSFWWHISSTIEITWSEELYRIYELDRSTPVTFERIRTRVHPDDVETFNRAVEAARATGNDFENQYRLLMPNNSIKYVHVVAQAFRDQYGQLEYIGAVQDVTERKLSEEALNKARSELAHVARVMSLGALTASIAHEVNQPLSGIITNASTCMRMLEADPPNVEGARETVRRTIRDGHRASDVITRLRALFSKKDATTEVVELNQAAREVIALTLSELQSNRVILKTELAEDLPLVAGDRVQLQQVILNLLRNASDAMSSVDDRPRQLLIRTEHDADGGVRLSVQDTGEGFELEKMNKLFEAFYTTKKDGMGIGLSVSRSIIANHRGRLWASQNDGAGATFSFSIPSHETARQS